MKPRALEVMTLGWVARRLEIAEGTVRRWADSGLLPCTRTSYGERVFNRADVELFAAQRRQQLKRVRV